MPEVNGAGGGVDSEVEDVGYPHHHFHYVQ